MTERLKIILADIPCGKVFADIGCDHGYIAKAMLISGKCERVIISDISAKCLSKAEKLLENEIRLGKATSVVSDGFEKVFGADVALIAGMGGEEISAIIDRDNLPENLVIQPMKNPEKARMRAGERGYKIVKDRVFKSAGKFYDLIVLKKGKEMLTQEEIEFGRDNLNGDNPDFKERIQVEVSKMENYLNRENLSEKTRLEISARLEKYRKYV